MRTDASASGSPLGAPLPSVPASATLSAACTIARTRRSSAPSDPDSFHDPHASSTVATTSSEREHRRQRRQQARQRERAHRAARIAGDHDAPARLRRRLVPVCADAIEIEGRVGWPTRHVLRGGAQIGATRGSRPARCPRRSMPARPCGWCRRTRRRSRCACSSPRCRPRPCPWQGSRGGRSRSRRPEPSPAMTTSVPRTPPRTTPLSPTTTAPCDSTEPSIVPSMRNAPSAVRSPRMTHDRPTMFSIASRLVADPSGFDAPRHEEPPDLHRAALQETKGQIAVLTRSRQDLDAPTLERMS